MRRRAVPGIPRPAVNLPRNSRYDIVHLGLFQSYVRKAYSSRLILLHVKFLDPYICGLAPPPILALWFVGV